MFDIKRRLIAPCSTFIPENDDVKVDIDAFIWRLLFFDTYILITTRLKEISHLTEFIGFDGLNILLSSGALKLYCDATMPAQTGQNRLLKSRKEKGILPTGSYSFSIICPHDREKYIFDCLRSINGFNELSERRKNILRDNVYSSIVERKSFYGQKAIKQLKHDMINNSYMIKKFICDVLFSNYRIISHVNNFSLEFDQIDENDFKSNNNIGIIYSLSAGKVHRIIEKSLLALASLNFRFETMDNYSAISGCLNKDKTLIGEKINLLAKSISPEDNEFMMDRIVNVGDLPSIKKDSSLRIDINKLLKIRD